MPVQELALTGLGPVKGHGGRGGAGGVSRGFQTVGEATRVADDGGGVGPGVLQPDVA